MSKSCMVYELRKSDQGLPYLLRVAETDQMSNHSISNSYSLYQMVSELFSPNSLSEEYIWLIALDAKNKPLGIFEISHGTSTGALVSPKQVMTRAILCGAERIALFHNHPSGDPTPSHEDCKITDRIKKAGKLMDIQLIDHIIVGDGVYYSFCDSNAL